MSQGSNSLFTNKSKYRLNQLFGYQDADEHRENENRLRDAFQEQHAWNDSMDDADWKINFPNWNLGAHRGTVGIDMRGIGSDETFFFGDGSGLTNLSKGGFGDLSQLMSNKTNTTLAYGYGAPIWSSSPQTDYWALGWVANYPTTVSIPAGTYWSPTMISATRTYQGGCPISDGASLYSESGEAGMPWHHLGGTFVMHHRCIFNIRHQFPPNAWTGASVTLRFRLVGEDGVVYGTNGAGDANGYSDGNITFTPSYVLSGWTNYAWLIETKFSVQGLPAQRYRLQHGVTMLDFGNNIRSSIVVWSGVSLPLSYNHGGSYPSITAPGFWEVTKTRFDTLHAIATVLPRTGAYAWNRYHTWTTAD